VGPDLGDGAHAANSLRPYATRDRRSSTATNGATSMAAGCVAVSTAAMRVDDTQRGIERDREQARLFQPAFHDRTAIRVEPIDVVVQARGNGIAVGYISPAHTKNVRLAGAPLDFGRIPAGAVNFAIVATAVVIEPALCMQYATCVQQQCRHKTIPEFHLGSRLVSRYRAAAVSSGSQKPKVTGASGKCSVDMSCDLSRRIQ